jgi:photosystem II stability/assembly factor-like uncharacterized protein
MAASKLYETSGFETAELIDAGDRAGPGQLFAGLGDGTLLQSDDGGENWSHLGERIGGITALAVK